MAEQVRRARLRLTNAENKLAAAREEARLARQRRKAAKRSARQARKQVRLAKERVGRADVALARLEARLAQLSRPPVEAKSGKPAAGNAASTPRRKNPVRTAAVRRQRISKIKQPALGQTTAKPAMNPTDETTRIPGPVSAELETPVEVLPPSEHKPTQQIAKGIQEIFTGETAAPASRVPEVETDAAPEPPAAQLTISAQEAL